MKNFIKDESGVAMIEYGLLAALIAVVCISSVSKLGTTMSSMFKVVYLHLEIITTEMGMNS